MAEGDEDGRVGDPPLRRGSGLRRGWEPGWCELRVNTTGRRAGQRRRPYEGLDAGGGGRWVSAGYAWVLGVAATLIPAFSLKGEGERLDADEGPP